MLDGADLNAVRGGAGTITIKNVGIVVIPMELLLDVGVLHKDAPHLVKLPEGVRIRQTYEDFYRQTYNIMLISDEPVEGVTFPTEPGTHATEVPVELRDGRIRLRRA